MSAGCAEIRKPRKIRGFIHFGETGDEPNSFYFISCTISDGLKNVTVLSDRHFYGDFF